MQKKPQPTQKLYRVQIILVGLPKGVFEAINQLHLAKLVLGGNWIKSKHDKDSGELTVTATISFFL